GRGPLVDVDVGAGVLLQVGVAADVVGVEVGLDDVGDGQPVGGGRVEVFPHIAVGIDDRSHARAFAAHQIGSATQPVDEELFQIHDVLSLDEESTDFTDCTD